MTRSIARPALRAAAMTAVALVLAATLSACGRKGPLDPPPASSAVQQGPVEEPAPASGAQPTAAQTGYDEQGRPVAPRGQRKPFLLDWLLN